MLYSVSAVLLLETLTAAASVGTAAVFWWLFLGVVFLLPFALICAGMGCTYPEEGGIYAWVRDAFGRRWGARASWGYWVNTAVWLPAIYLLFAGIFSQLFAPALSLWGQIGIGIALAWLTVLLNVITLDVGKWVPNAGAVIKVLVFAAAITGAFLHTFHAGTANELTLALMLLPDLSDGFQFLPAIIYGMLGFELVSASSEEMKHPARDVPRGVLISSLLIMLLYTLATIAVLALYAFSAVIFLLPCLGMMLAFLRCRQRDPDRHRPFRIGGGIHWSVLLGATFTIALGEIVIRNGEQG